MQTTCRAYACDEAAAALERTAVSPVVTESKDYSCTMLDGQGRLIMGAGQIQFHFGAASNAVRSTMARFPDSIADGDVFISNDSLAGPRCGRTAWPAPRRRPGTTLTTWWPTGDRLPLYPGVVNQGGVAIAEVSGAVLARSPEHWTEGCAVLVERRPEGGPEVLVRSYLDPQTGAILYAEASPAGEARGFECSPSHWTNPAG